MNWVDRLCLILFIVFIALVATFAILKVHNR